MAQSGYPKKGHNGAQQSTKQDDNTETCLECPVCLDAYNEGLHSPKMMPCLHTICADCIVKLTATAPTRGNNNSSTSGTRAFPSFSFSTPQHGLFPNLGNSGAECRRTYATEEPLGFLQPIPLLFGPIPRHPLFNATNLSGRQTNPQPPNPTYQLVHQSPRTQPPPNSPRTHQSASHSSPPPKPGSVSEPMIPKNVQIQCPVCRSSVNTSKIQTNRYILAHMRDLTRLSKPTTSCDSPTRDKLTTTSSDESAAAQSKPLKELWCEECKQSATSVCADHKCIHATEWMETQRAVLESLQLEVNTKLGQHITYLDDLNKIIENVHDALTKSSRFVMEAYDQVGGFKEEMKNLVKLPTTENSPEKMKALMGKVKEMERLAETVSKEDHLMSGNAEVTVTFQQSSSSSSSQQEVFIRTNNPKQFLTVTVAQDDDACREPLVTL